MIDSLLENYNGSIIKERNKDNDVRKESGDENARALPVDDELCECLDKANSDEEMIECQPEYTVEELESIRSEECSSDSFGPKELLLEVNNKQFNDLLKNKNLTYSFIMENVKNNN